MKERKTTKKSRAELRSASPLFRMHAASDLAGVSDDTAIEALARLANVPRTCIQYDWKDDIRWSTGYRKVDCSYVVEIAENELKCRTGNRNN